MAVAVASARATKAIFAELARAGHDPISAMQRGDFVLFESSDMLSRFMSRTGVNADRFECTVGAAMRHAKARAGAAPLHAFGDMVGVLWQRERREDAVELERLWIRLQEELGFALFCAYPIDIFGHDFDRSMLDGVFETHTHFCANPSSAALGRAFDRAIDEVLGQRAGELRSLSTAVSRDGLPAMPKLEEMILSLRENLPEHADAILTRARTYYESAEPRRYLREQHARR